MNDSGLPAELEDLLRRLRDRGIPVTTLEVTRLRYLLDVDGAYSRTDLLSLLAALLCKTPRHRTLLAREYRRWASELERSLDPTPDVAEPGSESDKDGTTLSMRGEMPDHPAEDGKRRQSQAQSSKDRRYRYGAAGAVGILALIAVFPLLIREQDSSSTTQTTPPSTRPAFTAPTPGAMCPQELPIHAVKEVWAWVPQPDYRPWLTLGGGAFLLLGALLAGRRLYRASSRYLQAADSTSDENAAPTQNLLPMEVRGDLLLEPEQRREMVWSIDQFVSEDPSPDLDLAATVAATADAGGEPCIVHGHLRFPREVWLWCDRKSAQQELQERLVAEIRRALDQANLPVRVAYFHGLPTRLRWQENNEPFAPEFTEAAGAQATVAVLTDGDALVRAWRNPGERRALSTLLRQLRTWPRLCLVDLGRDRELSAMATEWRLEITDGERLADWLAQQPEAQAEREQADPAQLDLWIAGWLLVGPPADHTAAQLLRERMGLNLSPLHYPLFTERLEACNQDPDLANRLVNRLARSQALNTDGKPDGEGYFTRALDFWEQRYEQALHAVAEDDTATGSRLEIGLGKLKLWRDPEQAADKLIRYGRGRNRSVILGLLGNLKPSTEAPYTAGERVERPQPTWAWSRQTRATQVRLLKLGLSGLQQKEWQLGPAFRQHLALALLAGIALGGLSWGGYRLLAEDTASDPVFADRRFKNRVVTFEHGERLWLGSHWHLTALPALGPLETPYNWSWEATPNPLELDDDAAIYLSGSQAYPIRGCSENWPGTRLRQASGQGRNEEDLVPGRSLAVIQADLDNDGARQLAIRLLDRSSADRVLVASNWPDRLDALSQDIVLEDDQLLLFLPTDSPEPAKELWQPYANAAFIRGAPAELAAGLDFPGARSPLDAWPSARTTVLAGDPKLLGGPEMSPNTMWVHVCGGTFRMGTPLEEDRFLDDYAKTYTWIDEPEERKKSAERWLNWERPQHKVLVDDFWITRTEMTASDKGEAAMPLVNVDWRAAGTACEELPTPPLRNTEQWAPENSLPREAQWEFAARAGTGTRWSYGDKKELLGEYAWYADNSRARAHPVGTRNPNGLCLADMHGNVWEWVNDCFDEEAYGKRSTVLTVDPAVDNASCDRRVVRGGSFVDPPFGLRSASRFGDQPDDRGDLRGLRCVRSRVRQH